MMTMTLQQFPLEMVMLLVQRDHCHESTGRIATSGREILGEILSALP